MSTQVTTPDTAPAAATLPSRVVGTRAETRFANLSAVRAAMIAITAAAGALDPGLVASERHRLAVLVGMWLGVLVVGEVARRLDRAAGLAGRVAYLLDGVFVTAATIAAGGTSSPLFFLAFMHVIAVTLMGSHLTGLKVALWDSGLLLVAAAAETAGAVPFLTGGDPVQAAAAVIRSLALLLISGVTSAGSGVNERELIRSRRDLVQLLHVGENLESAETVEDSVAAALEALVERMDFTTAAVVLYLGDAPPIAARAVRGADPEFSNPELPAGEPLPPVEPVLEASADALPWSTLRTLLEGEDRVLVVPVIAGDVTGVLGVAVGRSGAAALATRTISTVTSIANRTGRTVQRIQLGGQVERLANTDALTNLANRRSFDASFELLHTTSRLRRQSLSVLMVDLDHFKRVNDLHGHLVGDEVLREVAATLQANSRAQDVVARFGGEEFAVLLPATGVTEATRAAERLRVAVARITSPVTVTASIGVASSPTHSKLAGALFAACDEALYQAKAGGRNRVCVAAVGKNYRTPTRRSSDEAALLADAALAAETAEAAS